MTIFKKLWTLTPQGYLGNFTVCQIVENSKKKIICLFNVWKDKINIHSSTIDIDKIDFFTLEKEMKKIIFQHKAAKCKQFNQRNF